VGPALRLLLLGPPGAGKGTQARKLAERLGVPHVASGELLRQAAADRSPIGLKAKAYMDRGEYVPDEIMIWFISEHLNELGADGFVLDGFPRTIEQAKALDLELDTEQRPLQIVIGLDVPDDEVERRLTGRRTCPSCQRTYHMHYDPPAVDEVCDEDGTKLATRPDDEPETVRRRLQVFHQQTDGLYDYFRERGNLVSVDGCGELDEVSKRIDEAIEAGPR